MNAKERKKHIDIRNFAFTDRDIAIRDAYEKQVAISGPCFLYAWPSDMRRWEKTVMKKYSIDDPEFYFRFIKIKEIIN